MGGKWAHGGAGDVGARIWHLGQIVTPILGSSAPIQAAQIVLPILAVQIQVAQRHPGEVTSPFPQLHRSLPQSPAGLPIPSQG